MARKKKDQIPTLADIFKYTEEQGGEVQQHIKEQLAAFAAGQAAATAAGTAAASSPSGIGAATGAAAGKTTPRVTAKVAKTANAPKIVDLQPVIEQLNEVKKLQSEEEKKQRGRVRSKQKTDEVDEVTFEELSLREELAEINKNLSIKSGVGKALKGIGGFLENQLPTLQPIFEGARSIFSTVKSVTEWAKKQKADRARREEIHIRLKELHAAEETSKDIKDIKKILQDEEREEEVEKGDAWLRRKEKEDEAAFASEKDLLGKLLGKDDKKKEGGILGSIAKQALEEHAPAILESLIPLFLGARGLKYIKNIKNIKGLLTAGKVASEAGKGMEVASEIGTAYKGIGGASLVSASGAPILKTATAGGEVVGAASGASKMAGLAKFAKVGKLGGALAILSAGIDTVVGGVNNKRSGGSFAAGAVGGLLGGGQGGIGNALMQAVQGAVLGGLISGGNPIGIISGAAAGLIFGAVGGSKISNWIDNFFGIKSSGGEGAAGTQTPGSYYKNVLPGLGGGGGAVAPDATRAIPPTTVSTVGGGGGAVAPDATRAIPPTTVSTDQVENILSNIKDNESYGGQNIKSSRSSASGPFQITNSTWKSLGKLYGVDTKRYPTAMSAPISVQENVARRYVTDILQQNGGDISAVPRAWWGPTDNARTAAANNGMNRKAYVDKWMRSWNSKYSKTTPSVAHTPRASVAPTSNHAGPRVAAATAMEKAASKFAASGSVAQATVVPVPVPSSNATRGQKNITRPSRTNADFRTTLGTYIELSSGGWINPFPVK